MEAIIEASKLLQQNKAIDVGFIENIIEKWSQPDFRPDKPGKQEVKTEKNKPDRPGERVPSPKKETVKEKVNPKLQKKQTKRRIDTLQTTESTEDLNTAR